MLAHIYSLSGSQLNWNACLAQERLAPQQTTYYLSVSGQSVHSKAKALMENRPGKNAHASQYLRLTSHPFSKYLTVHTMRTTFTIPSLQPWDERLSVHPICTHDLIVHPQPLAVKGPSQSQSCLTPMFLIWPSSDHTGSTAMWSPAPPQQHCCSPSSHGSLHPSFILPSSLEQTRALFVQAPCESHKSWPVLWQFQTLQAQNLLSFLKGHKI